MKEARQILFQNYLSDGLTSDEKKRFESQLASDSVFRMEFELYKEMNVFLEDRKDKGSALEVLREVGGEVKAPQRNLGLLWKAALGLLLITLVGFLIIKFNKDNSEPPAYAQLYVEPTWPIERSDAKDSISIAVAKYLHGDLASATKELRVMQTEDSHYWLTEIYAKEMVHDSVVKYASLNYQDKILREKCIYLKIISLWYSNRSDTAKSLIKNLPENYNDWYFNRLNSLK